jgi:hypothetical protein
MANDIDDKKLIDNVCNEVEFEDRWQALFVLVQLQLRKMLPPKPLIYGKN